jgi:DNA-binding HxlR family transcriptional regulator
MNRLATDGNTPELKVRFVNCPVRESLGVLGRKWALLVIRNIALYRKQRFNEMLSITPGLSRRVLSTLLKQLRHEGFIKLVDTGRGYSKWSLTEKGTDVLPILITLVQFGSKYYAKDVFANKTPRTLRDVFDEGYIRQVMGGGQ